MRLYYKHHFIYKKNSLVPMSEHLYFSLLCLSIYGVFVLEISKIWLKSPFESFHKPQYKSYMQLILKVLHVDNPHLHVHLLSCVLVEFTNSHGDCHMTQYDLDP